MLARRIAALVKWLLPGMAIATLARAQMGAQEFPTSRPQAALSVQMPRHSAPPRRGRADFRGEIAPIDVQRMAEWVATSADNGGLPFAIIDKKGAEVFVFNRQGQLLDAAPALLGLAVGDDSVPGVGEEPLSAIPPEDRTTPAGRFVAYVGQEPGKPNTLWVDHKDNVALHRVITGRPKDHRLQRLATPTPLDNRITFGCINVPIDFFERTVLPAFTGTEGIVYILPEIKATREVFSNYYDVGA